MVVVRYTLLRLALFAAVLLVLSLAGARGVLLLALTVVVSMGLSYLLLRKQRDAVAAVVAERLAARAGQPHAPAGDDEAAEDVEDDARRAQPRPADAQPRPGAQADSASPRPNSTP
jgi:hypothetical protein